MAAASDPPSAGGVYIHCKQVALWRETARLSNDMTQVADSYLLEFSTYSDGREDSPPDLRFIHYNDVYHVEAGSREPVGGIARFQTLCNYYADDERFKDQAKLVTFFSGDAFNPSLESSVTKGAFISPLLSVDTC